MISDRDNKELLKLARIAVVYPYSGIGIANLTELIQRIDSKALIARVRMLKRKRKYTKKYGVKEGLLRWRQATQDVKMPRRKKRAPLTPQHLANKRRSERFRRRANKRSRQRRQK